jgi:predicted TIM-barrel enzyme
VKHAAPAGSNDVSLLAKDSALRGGADVLILTGARTGSSTNIDDVRLVRSMLPNIPVWIGSGVTPQNLHVYQESSSGAVIGSYLHEEGRLDRPLCKKRAKEFGLLDL